MVFVSGEYEISTHKETPGANVSTGGVQLTFGFSGITRIPRISSWLGSNSGLIANKTDNTTPPLILEPPRDSLYCFNLCLGL